MEGSHCELCTRLTDWLSSNNTNSFTNCNRLTVGKVWTVTLTAYTMLCTTAEYGTNLNAFNTAAYDKLSFFFAHHNIIWNQNISVFITEVINQITSHKTFFKAFNYVAFADNIEYLETFLSTAVILTDDNILWYVNKTSCKVTWVGSSKSCICKTFTSTTRRDKVL